MSEEVLDTELMDTTLSLVEAAAYLDISEGRTRDLLRAGTLPGTKTTAPGSDRPEWRVTVRALEAHLAKSDTPRASTGGTSLRVSGLTEASKAALVAWAEANGATTGPAWYKQDPEVAKAARERKKANRENVRADLAERGLPIVTR